MTEPTPAPLCSICGKPVELETSKTDSHAEAVHEEGYACKIEFEKAGEFVPLIRRLATQYWGDHGLCRR